MSGKLETKVEEHFKKLVPELVKHLGDDFEKFEYELSAPNVFSISSSFFFDLKLWLKEKTDSDKSDKDKKERVLNMRLFAKTAITSEIVQRLHKLDLQFRNEAAFYQRYAKDDSRYPKCIYIEESLPYGPTLIIEDVTVRGYSVHPKKVDLPLSDILAAMKEIARFHAKGYIMKEENPEEFSEMLKVIKDCRYDTRNNDNNDTNGDPNNVNPFFYISNASLRSVDYLKKSNYDKKFCEKVEKLFEQTYRNVMLKAIVPTEPLATLCHGDFTVNNVLFKKAETEGAENQVMLIDFAMLRYASPTIDLSTFLCLSCSKEDRRVNFTKIMRAYHNELIACLEKAQVKNLERFAYEYFWKDYIEHALFGFVTACFFLHVLMGKVEMSLEELLEKDIQEIVKLNMECGGDEVSAILADMLLDLDKLGCLDAFL